MNDDKLDSLLHGISKDPIPPPPSNLANQVLSIIRDTSSSNSPRTLWLFGVLSNSLGAQLRFASLIAFLAMGTGLIVGSVYALPTAKHDVRSHRSAAALSFDVFSPDAARLHHRFLEK